VLARELVREAWAPVAVAALLVAASTALFVHDRGEPAVTLDDHIVAAQRAHAREHRPADLVVVGDSSALMGVDPVLLGQRLNLRVESYALLAWAGPAAWGAVAAEAGAAGPPKVAVLGVNAAAVGLSDGRYHEKGTEHLIVEGTRDWPRFPWTAGRDRTYELVVDPLMRFPLPGSYGVAYGYPDVLRARLMENHGGLIDPNRLAAGPAAPVRAQPSPAFLGRLPRLWSRLEGLGVERVMVVSTPVPAARCDAQTEHELAGVRAAIAATARPGWVTALDLPVCRPDADFATATHLAAPGRAAFTVALAEALGGVGR
jgi:hypothetical protein